MAAANASGYQRYRSVFGYYQNSLRMQFFVFWHARYFYAEFLKLLLWSAFLFIALSWTLADSEPGPGLVWPGLARHDTDGASRGRFRKQTDLQIAVIAGSMNVQ